MTTTENTLTFEEYIVLVMSEKIAHPEWRLGQTYYHILDDIRPDLNASIIDTHGDPYHTDSNINRYLDFVASNW
jgi:hypothetical protein